MSFLHDGPDDATCRVLLAHGAGAAMDSPFMSTFASLLAARGLAVSRFEFGYMAARRTRGKKRPPPRADLLAGEYEAAVADLRAGMPPDQGLVIGGKSMGGRVASLVADALQRQGFASGLVCLGYPFHPPAKPENLRTLHLAAITCPTLIVQGERDPFGTRAEVEALIADRALSPAIAFHWAHDGDHDLGPRGGQGVTRKGNLAAAADAVAAFAIGLR
ncbi:MAG: alpha/beta family hydrolase [Hyphomicrobiaceae bacterium]